MAIAAGINQRSGGVQGRGFAYIGHAGRIRSGAGYAFRRRPTVTIIRAVLRFQVAIFAIYDYNIIP